MCKQTCANNILMHALRIMVALLCIALTRVCEAIRKCHGVELVRVTLLTLRSEPEPASELCFKTVLCHYVFFYSVCAEASFVTFGYRAFFDIFMEKSI